MSKFVYVVFSRTKKEFVEGASSSARDAALWLKQGDDVRIYKYDGKLSMPGSATGGRPSKKVRK